MPWLEDKLQEAKKMYEEGEIATIAKQNLQTFKSTIERIWLTYKKFSTDIRKWKEHLWRIHVKIAESKNDLPDDLADQFAIQWPVFAVF